MSHSARAKRMARHHARTKPAALSLVILIFSRGSATRSYSSYRLSSSRKISLWRAEMAARCRLGQLVSANTTRSEASRP